MTAGFATRACPGCGSDRSREEVHSDPRAEMLPPAALRRHWAGFHDDKTFFSYHRCLDCRLLFAPAFFEGEQLAELYSDLAPNMDMVPLAAVEATQRDYFAAATRAGTPGGGYLEIGPDVGHVVRHAAGSMRFDRFWLFEPNRAVHDRLAAAADPFPRQLHTDMDDLSPVPDRSVGLAVMIQVLDHLLEPACMLEQIRRKLRAGGKLVIVTHDESSLLRKATGRRWPPFCLQHPAIFSPTSIRAMVKRAGYSDVSVRGSMSYFPVDFLVRQAGRAMGLRLDRLPLPKAVAKAVVGLKLGNMITVATR